VAAPIDLNEAELVAALRRGEPRAFDVVYARYRVRIYSFLVRLCGRRDVADDLFQETFLQLARHAKTLTADTQLSAFLYTVARNRYRNHRRLSLFRLDRLRQLFAAHEDAAESETPFESATASATARQLEKELAALSPPLREALLLVAVEGLSNEVAARVLDIEPATLRQRLSRARAELSRRLADRSPDTMGGDHGPRT
jgi:RNA polymerase sigma-70 factor (ECF subfamily)